MEFSILINIVTFYRGNNIVVQYNTIQHKFIQDVEKINK